MYLEDVSILLSKAFTSEEFEELDTIPYQSIIRALNLLPKNKRFILQKRFVDQKKLKISEISKLLNISKSKLLYEQKEALKLFKTYLYYQLGWLDVKYLPLNNHIKNTLVFYGIRTYGDFTSITEESLNNMKGIGSTCTLQIANLRSTLGCPLSK